MATFDAYGNPTENYSQTGEVWSNSTGGTNFYDPLGLFSGTGVSRPDSWTSYLADPLDLFGNRAKYAQEQQNAIAQGSADRSINALRDQYGSTLNLQQPFLGLGQQGLAQMGQYQQGENFNQQLNEGSRALRGGALASGLGNSSAAGRQMAGFVGNLTQEDMNRQYQQALNNILIGQGAVGTLGQAAQGLGSGASNIYGNWGQQSAQNALGYGQARSNAFSGAGDVAAGLGNYIDYQRMG